MTWTFIDPETVNKTIFGFKEKVFCCKVAKWHCKYDIRMFQLKGWNTIGDLIEYDPITGNKLKNSQWYVFAAKGV